MRPYVLILFLLLFFSAAQGQAGPHAQVKLVVSFQNPGTDSLIRKIPDGMSFEHFLKEVMISDSLLVWAAAQTGTKHDEKTLHEIREKLDVLVIAENNIVQINFFHKDEAYAVRFLDELSNGLMSTLVEYKLSVINKKLLDIEKEEEAMKKVFEEPDFDGNRILIDLLYESSIPALKAREKILILIKESCLTTIRFIEEENDEEWDDFLPTAYYEDEKLSDEIRAYRNLGYDFIAPEVIGEAKKEQAEEKELTPDPEREKLKALILPKLKDRILWVEEKHEKNNKELEEAFKKLPEEDRKKVAIIIVFNERSEVLHAEKYQLDAIKEKVVKPIKTIEGTVYLKK